MAWSRHKWVTRVHSPHSRSLPCEFVWFSCSQYFLLHPLTSKIQVSKNPTLHTFLWTVTACKITCKVFSFSFQNQEFYSKQFTKNKQLKPRADRALEIRCLMPSSVMPSFPLVKFWQIIKGPCDACIDGPRVADHPIWMLAAQLLTHSTTELTYSHISAPSASTALRTNSMTYSFV